MWGGNDLALLSGPSMHGVRAGRKPATCMAISSYSLLPLASGLKHKPRVMRRLEMRQARCRRFPNGKLLALTNA